MRFSLIFLIVPLMIRCGGTTDETLSSQGTVYYTDGSRAASAEISVFELTDDSIPVYTTITDKRGGYEIDTILSGKYNIWARKDTLVGCKRSVVLVDKYSRIPNDTLHEPEFILGVVKMQPNHDPHTVTIHVIGSDLHNPYVQSNGRFVISNLDRGEYLLQFSTNIENYTTTFKSFTARSLNIKDDTWFTDTVTLDFTGIPVVTGFATR